MAEELRIIVTDQGAAQPSGAQGQAPAPRTQEEMLGAIVDPPDLPMRAPSSAPAAGAEPPVARREQAGEGEEEPILAEAVPTLGVAGIAGPLGRVVAVFAAQLGVAAAGIRQFVARIGDLVDSQIAQTAGFSAEVGQAQAETQLQRTLADIRRAQRLGPDLATIERGRSRLDVAIQDLGTSILDALFQLLAELEPVARGAAIFIDRVAGRIDEIVMAFQQNEELVKTIKSILALHAAPIALAVQRLLGLAEEEAEERPGQDPFAEEFLRMIPRPPLFWPRDMPLPGADPVAPGV